LRKAGLDPVNTPDEYEAAWPEAIEVARAAAAEEAEAVRAAGGLYVLGTERHESRRIDNQLRGRSGRQGDPGESRFYLSLGDELMRRFNGAALESIMNRVNLPDDVPIEAKMVTKAIRSAQTQVEQQNFEVRKNVLKYDEVMNEQRKVIYSERRRILEGEDHREQVQTMIDDVVGAYVEGATGEGYAEDWDLDELWTALRTLYPIQLDPKEVVGENEFGERDDISAEELKDVLVGDARAAYEAREKEIESIAGEGAMRQLERTILLTVLDRKWQDHLYEMDYLREGIHLRSMAQRDPVVEYQREGFDMFHGMLDGLKEEALGFLYNVQVQTEQAPPRVPAPGAQATLSSPEVADFAAANGSATQEPETPEKQVPPALRAVGVEQPEVPMTFSGPSEGGGTEVHSAEEELDDPALVSATRRERRAAARESVKGARQKPPKSKKKRR
jgi:preprotein translocase subunit SecA